MNKHKFKVGDLVSFIHAGQKMNGVIEYALENNDYLIDGNYVIKPHPRYIVDQVILSEDQLKRLLDEDNLS